MSLLESLLTADPGRRRLAVLIDPDKHTDESLSALVKTADASATDCFLVGGSLLVRDRQERTIDLIRQLSKIPILLFPGSDLQLSPNADGILLLSLISGRNPDLLIGRHVVAAPYLKASGLEVIPVGYMLVGTGTLTTVAYMSNTMPIPAEKAEIAACTAMAGEMLGLRVLYLEAGSGAEHPVPQAMIAKVRAATSLPLIVGGGITTPEQARSAYKAGAGMVVVGNAAEHDPSVITAIARARFE